VLLREFCPIAHKATTKQEKHKSDPVSSASLCIGTIANATAAKAERPGQ
jgi:hypothetical protein